MKQRIFKIAGILLLTGLLAEILSHFFLPPPVLPRLPMLKQIADPAVGYRLEANQKAFTLASPVTTNRWGYRGKDWTVEKPANTIRIAILGASLTFGHGVKDEDTMPERLESLLNQHPPQKGMSYEVLNFGIGGYDIGHSLQVLKTDVLKFQPDLIVLSFFMGDVFYIKDYSFYPEFFRYQEKNFSRVRWDFLNFCRHSRLAMYLWDILKSRLGKRGPDEVSQMIQTYAIQGMSPLEGPQADGWRFIAERLAEYASITKNEAIPSFLLVLPPHEEISNPAAKGIYSDYLRQKCAEDGIQYLSFLPEVRKNQKLVESFFIPYDFHFKPAGHIWLAEQLYEKLMPSLKELAPS